MEGCTRASHVRYDVCRKARPQMSGFACQLIGIIKKPHRRSAVAHTQAKYGLWASIRLFPSRKNIYQITAHYSFVN